MDQENLTKRVEKLSSLLLNSPSISPNDPEPDPPGLLNPALHELGASLEELQAVEEEMRQQNDELASTRLALEFERKRYQDLFDFAPDGYLVTDLKGKILEANYRAGEMFSVQPLNMIGKPLANFVAGQDRAVFRRKLANLQLELSRQEREGGRGEWMLCMRPRRGSVFDAEIAFAIAREKDQFVLRWLIRDITFRKQLEQDHRDLLKRLLNTQEEERQRLSRELHDQVGQKIAVLILGLKSLETGLASASDLLETLNEIQGQVQDLGHEIHQAAFDLRPASLDELGLTAALRQYVEEWSQRHAIPLDFQANTLQDVPLSPQVSITIYRVVQEALRNIAEHSGASQASLILDRQPARLQVIVEDNGHGFDDLRLMSHPNGNRRLGILGMKERVEQAGGSFNIESEPGKGTTVFARFHLLGGAVRAAGKVGLYQLPLIPRRRPVSYG
jgi:PAS domain S-box-containing protein